MTIKELELREIFDSRGRSTIEAALHTGKGIFTGAVPAGKSTGSREAEVFPYPAAKKSVALIRKALAEKEFSSVREFDEALRALDGTERKTKLGGNAMLAVSIAFARARAAEKGISLWLLLRREFFPTANDARRPSLFSNLINGGAHASNGLDIQEYMLVVRPGKNYADDVRLLISLYEELGKLLKKRAKGALPIGDEGGYDVSFKDNFEPIEILGKLITAKKIGKKCSIALDAAATEFSSGKGKYKLGGKAYASSALLEEYASWFKRSKHLCSIEDPFAENEDEAFALLQKRLKEKWVVADDLTTTDPSRIRMLGERKAIGGVIVKPNQIGTVSESCDAITEARAKGVRVIVSHRSGETEDAFIISLARASAADGVKIGAPARERVSKFNELIRLYGE